jgi:hypothetical protein
VAVHHVASMVVMMMLCDGATRSVVEVVVGSGGTEG